MNPILYGYFRSSATYRVRIGLHLKGIAHQTRPVHLLRDGGEQFNAAFTQLNPQSLVPVLEDNGTQISQSLAILEYLDETRPPHPLLPTEPKERAHVRQLALMIACEIHPLNNLRVLKYLKHEFGRTDDHNKQWMQHWMALGFAALESLISNSALSGRFCCGDTPGLAECFLIPQLYNARRYEMDLAAYPAICAIEARCNSTDAFARAHPSQQPDAA